MTLKINVQQYPDLKVYCYHGKGLGIWLGIYVWIYMARIG